MGLYEIFRLALLVEIVFMVSGIVIIYPPFYIIKWFRRR